MIGIYAYVKWTTFLTATVYTEFIVVGRKTKGAKYQ